MTKRLEGVLRSRGLIEAVTSEQHFVQHLTSPRKVYCGFDPTADSLHIGNLLGLVTLLHFQQHGHQPIALVGGATGQIGDPSGRGTERTPMEKEQVAQNVISIQRQISKIFANGQGILDKYGKEMPRRESLIQRNNLDYYKDTNILTFFYDIGRHFRISHMLAKESVKARMEQQVGINFTEFSYQIFQAYDFHRLYQDDHCSIQIGGSDQWGNITAGIELINKLNNNSEHAVSKVFGLTSPLVTNANGEKFGKSAGNAVWMASHKTTPYNFFQFFLRVADQEVLKLLKLYTFIPMPEIEDIMNHHLKTPEKRIAQNRLAEEVTSLVHGEQEVSKVKVASEALFSNESELDFKKLTISQALQLFQEAPVAKVTKETVIKQSLISLATKYGLVKSKSEARRLVESGGLYLNNERVTDHNKVVEEGDLMDNAMLILRSGKKAYQIIIIENPK